MPELSVINDVIVEDDKEAGVMHFKPIEDAAHEQPQLDNRSWIQKCVDKMKSLDIKPYVKVRDLANPIGNRKDIDVGSDKKSSVEVGIKISF